MEKTAKYFRVRDDGRIKCLLCPVACILKEGQVGVCGGRYHKGDEIVVTNYGEVVSLAIDPIEKKPLYHFYPGSDILSTGPNGCNLSCANCQNWRISQEKINTQYVPPENLASISIGDSSIGVAYTYTEPFIWFEYLLDAMPLVREHGGKNVMVTNGYVMNDPLMELLPYIDAMNIDLKSMDKRFYLKICRGKLENVLNTIEKSFEAGVHIELTNLLITDLNDSPEQITQLVDWVASLSTEIPLHFSRYFPTYKLDKPATSLKILETAYRIAREKMNFVYLGNVQTDDSSNTRCPDCNATLVSRDGYFTTIVDLNGDRCANCGRKINIIT